MSHFYVLIALLAVVNAGIVKPRVKLPKVVAGHRPPLLGSKYTMTTDCGSTMIQLSDNQPSATIQTPMYPNPYPANASCTWQISTAAGSAILVHSNFFSLEPDDTQCAFDYLEVTDPSSADGPMKYCGLNTQIDYRSKGSQLTLKFSSDGMIQYWGFQIMATMTSLTTTMALTTMPTEGPPMTTSSSDPHMCDGKFKFSSINDQFHIQSPNYPNEYPSNSLCVLVFDNSEFFGSNYDVSFDFLSLNVEQDFDSVTIQSDTGFENTFSGPYPANTALKAPGNIIGLTFQSDDSVEYSGYDVTVSLVSTTCGLSVVLTKTGSVHLKSPNYPGDYDDFSNCLYSIVNPFSDTMDVELNFVFFVTEEDFDKLNIQSDSGSVDYSGTNTGLSLDIAGKVIVATFTSDESFDYGGFDIVVSLQMKPCIIGEEFRCRNGGCIPLSQRCDGTVQCPDGHDETDSICMGSHNCGTQSVIPNIDTKLTNGIEAKPGSWPWTVALVNTASNGGICAGALVADNFVVTSTECFPYFETNVPEAWNVVVGAHDLSESTDGSFMTKGDKVFTVPNSGISLIRLAAPVPFPYSSCINQACLPTDDGPAAGERCVLSSYGGSGSAQAMTEGIFPIQMNSACGVPDDDFRLRCAGGGANDNGASIDVSIDLGAPLVQKCANGTWNLVGLASPNQVGEKPSIFSTVSGYYLKSITDIIAAYN